MRLYSYVSNENGIMKQQGGNKELDIELLVEKVAGLWRTEKDTIKLFLRWNDENPVLHFEVPENWKPQKTQSKNVFRFQRVKNSEGK